MISFSLPAPFEKATIPLWDKPAPLSHGNAPADVPTLSPIFPGAPGSASPAVLICPGGGYEEHAFDAEIIHLCERFQEQGVATFILKYRLASDKYHYPAQLLDAQRALRLIRSRACDWNVDPSKVGVMGFSAGGHLASMVETHFDSGNPEAADVVERQSSRPDYAILVYPVIVSRMHGVHTGSSRNLLGPNPDPALVEFVSSDLQVTPQTPPTLLVHGEDDQTVSIEHSRIMAAALQKAGIPCALHAYPSGKHGFGCFANDPCPPCWLDRVLEWLSSQGFTNRKK